MYFKEQTYIFITAVNYHNCRDDIIDKPTSCIQELSMSKYNPLRDWLNNVSASIVPISFQEVDDLVGGLPASARKHTAWWENENVEKTAHTQCKSRQAAGYKAHVDLNLKKVTFVRD
jgi:hypothetical protein